MNPEVYIYILNHNYGRYFERCFRSILDQTYSNIKLVVYDDGSTDGSQSLISKLCDEHNIEYQLNPKLGFMFNVRSATKGLTSKYFMRVDADDYCEPELVETLVELLEKNDNAGLAFPNYDEVDELENVLTKVERFNFQDNVTVFDLPAHGACTLIRTTHFNSVGGYSLEIEKQDGYNLWLKFHGKYEVCNTSKELFHYRQHSSNLTKNNRSLLIARSKIFSASCKGNKNKNTTCVIPFREGELNLLLQEKLTIQGTDYNFYKLLHALVCSDYLSQIILVSGDEKVNLEPQYLDKIEIFKRPCELEKSGKSVIETIEWLKQEQTLKNENVLLVNPSYVFAPKEYIDGFLASVKKFNYDVSFTFCFNNSLLYQHKGKGLVPMYSSEIRRENDMIFERKGLFTYLNLNRMNEPDKMIGHFEIDKLSSYSVQEFSNLFGTNNEKS
jgi:glycosyltransferase involved in cell wall biosynthesis